MGIKFQTTHCAARHCARHYANLNGRPLEMYKTGRRGRGMLRVGVGEDAGSSHTRVADAREPEGIRLEPTGQRGAARRALVVRGLMRTSAGAVDFLINCQQTLDSLIL